MGKEGEVLEIIVENWLLFSITAVALLGFSQHIKNLLKQQREDVEDKSLLEVHHKKPIFKGGESTIENGEAVTRPEHAHRHWSEAMSSEDRGDARAHFWSVSKIIQRMKPGELDEFNDMIKKK